MHARKHTKMLHEGKYVAEVEIEIIDSEEGWSPYISLEDALKMDEIREALRKNDLERAKKLAKIYILKPVAA
jgi:FAD synthase